jgi:hypothetical protein
VVGAAGLLSSFPFGSVGDGWKVWTSFFHFFPSLVLPPAILLFRLLFSFLLPFFSPFPLYAALSLPHYEAAAPI